MKEKINLKYLVILMFLICCDKKSELADDISLEGNWYTIYGKSEGFEGAERYQEIYFTKELYFWNDWYQLDQPRFYELRSDSFFIGGLNFYFKLIDYQIDSCQIEYEDGKQRWLIRLDTIETPFRGLMVIDEEFERLRMNRIDRGMEKLNR